MKTTLVTVAAIAATFTLAGTAHADGQPTAAGACDGITVTTPAAGSTFLSVDGAPPMALAAGTTLIYPLPDSGTDHHWTVMTIADGPWTGDPVQVAGDITCALPEPTVAEPPTVEPVVQLADTPVLVGLEQWTSVALAPPW